MLGTLQCKVTVNSDNNVTEFVYKYKQLKGKK